MTDLPITRARHARAAAVAVIDREAGVVDCVQLRDLDPENTP